MSVQENLNKLINLPLNNRIFNLAESFNGKAMLVGGCVRNALLDEKFDIYKTDFDFAVDFKILDFLKLAENSGLKIYDKDIRYGTISISDKDNIAQITQLRIDIKNFGRHANILPTNNWFEDSNRRDFTVNAIYLDKDGVIFDPQSGFNDLLENKLKFVGNAKYRIKEDRLRILRAFRISSQNIKLELNKANLEILKENINEIQKISKSRVLSEFEKIFKSPGLKKTLTLFSFLNVDQILFDEKFNLKIINNNNYLKILNYYNFMILLSLMLKKEARKKILNNYNINKNDKKTIISIDKKVDDKVLDLLMGKNWKKACYWLKNNTSIIYVKNCIEKKIPINYNKLHSILNHNIPVFPISGKEIKNKYNISGETLGNKIRELEFEWVNKNFPENFKIIK